MGVIASVLRDGLAWFGAWLILSLVCDRFSFVELTVPVMGIIAVVASLLIIMLEYMAD